MWNREDIIWAAGLFEGEGCITFNGCKYAKLALGTTDMDVISKFHSIVKLGSINKSIVKARPQATKQGKPYKTCFYWSVTRFEHVQAILAAFWPWLGQRRRARAEEVLTVVVASCCRTDSRRGRNRPRAEKHLVERLTLQDLEL